MNGYDIYSDIAKRTNGDIYIGVVGPVRTGKSTFIKSFMEKFVLPNIDNEFRQDRAKDELPQSASGKTIMTTEPKFVPNESVEITIDKNIKVKTRLVDCVGYLVDGALGSTENNLPRMVNTPWFDEQIPFTEAAEIGTRKVITDHSTVGVLVTTDGSITDIPRESYVAAEKRVVDELKAMKKPFTILLNSTTPEDENTQRLARELEEKYDAPVVTADVSELSEATVAEVFGKILEEFPVSEIGFKLPRWFESLEIDHWLKRDVVSIVKSSFKDVNSIREVSGYITSIKNENDIIEDINIRESNMENGSVKIEIQIKPELFYKILSEISNFEIQSDGDIFKLMKDYSKIKGEYDKIAVALEEVRVKGYGIVAPQMEELKLEEPEIVKQGNKFGVKLRASAPSIHMIRADIETEISPIVGSEKQSEDLVKYLLSGFETDPKTIWQSNIFGKSLHELVNEGLHNKLYRMPDEAQMKLQETLQRIINEGSGGLICIIL